MDLIIAFSVCLALGLLPYAVIQYVSGKAFFICMALLCMGLWHIAACEFDVCRLTDVGFMFLNLVTFSGLTGGIVKCALLADRTAGRASRAKTAALQILSFAILSLGLMYRFHLFD